MAKMRLKPWLAGPYGMAKSVSVSNYLLSPAGTVLPQETLLFQGRNQHGGYDQEFWHLT